MFLWPYCHCSIVASNDINYQWKRKFFRNDKTEIVIYIQWRLCFHLIETIVYVFLSEIFFCSINSVEADDYYINNRFIGNFIFRKSIIVEDFRRVYRWFNQFRNDNATNDFRSLTLRWMMHRHIWFGPKHWNSIGGFSTLGFDFSIFCCCSIAQLHNC